MISTVEMMKGLYQEVLNNLKRVGNGEKLMCTPEKAAERLDICKACEFLTEAGRCEKCGCFMSKKVLLKASKCPIDKWGIDNT